MTTALLTSAHSNVGIFFNNDGAFESFASVLSETCELIFYADHPHLLRAHIRAKMPGHDFRLTTPEGLLPTVYGMIFPCWDNISTETINMSADVSVSITERYSHGQFEFVEVGYAKATDATIRYELEFKPYTKERDGLMPSSHVFITIRMGEVVLFNGWPEELSEACANIKLMGQIPEIL